MASTSPQTDGFDIAPSWVSVEEKKEDRPAEPVLRTDAEAVAVKKRSTKKKSVDYYPLTDTIRLYAGWLLAWYFLIYMFGAYQFTRALPVKISIVDDLFFSPLILHFAAAAFIFLLLSSVHRVLGRKILLGVGLFIIGVVMYWGFRMYA